MSSMREDTIDAVVDVLVDYLVQEDFDYQSIAAALRDRVDGDPIVTRVAREIANEIEARSPS